MFYSILTWACGFLVGVIVVKMMHSRMSMGTVRRLIDSETGEVYMFAELKRPISEVFEKSHVVFCVDKTIMPRK